MTELIIFGAVPMIATILFLFLTNKTGFGKINKWVRKGIIGLVFGVILCVSMSFGIEKGGFAINVFTALPLVSGSVFGGFVGIITGVIGFVFRFLCPFSDGYSFAYIADLITILLSGIVAALFRKFFFDSKKPSLWYCGLIAVFIEGVRMLTVFLTHMNGVMAAFEYVKITALWSIASNVGCVLLAVAPVMLLFFKKESENGKSRRARRPLTRSFALGLLICVVLSFAATGFFTTFLQNNLSRLEVEKLLSMNVADAVSDISTSVDRELLSLSMTLADRINQNDITAGMMGVETKRSAFPNNTGNQMKLGSFAKSNTLSVAAIVGSDGIIDLSTNQAWSGINIADDPVLKAFASLIKNEDDPFDSNTEGFAAPDFTVITIDGEDYKFKVAGVTLEHRVGFMLCAFNEERFNQSLEVVVSETALNRHVGQSGFIFVMDAETAELVSSPDGCITPSSACAIYETIDSSAQNQVLTYTDDQGVGYNYLLAEANGYMIIGCIPTSEATMYRDMSIYVSAFMLLLVFFMLFTVVFLLLKGLIVNNIHKVNNSLTKITEGDLSTRIEIHDNQEFDKLSDDINATVGRLKELIAEAEKRIDAELEIAKSIQLSVLPTVSAAYQNRKEFDIFATMNPAKEVGGDFYDFYFVGENHLAFLIADVSGKGIPAAMFMMNAKSIIKDLCESGLSPAEVFEKANNKFCEANDAGMFVTAWLGLLDLTTGLVRFANAGHNRPLIRHGDGQFAYYKSRVNFVLAGMEDTMYTLGEFKLDPGDEILLYTDGVTEATSASEELFGEDRLLEVMNNTGSDTAADVCKNVKKAVDGFVGDAPQFDDITILSLKYKG